MLKEWERNGAIRTEMKPDEKSKARPFLVPGDRVEGGGSPPRKGVVENGGEVEVSTFSTTTPLIRGWGGGGDGGSASSGGGETDWHGNPALGRRGPILALGETCDEPIPGWDDE
jgi:hypothetical protein